jgi:hypothetical protein
MSVFVKAAQYSRQLMSGTGRAVKSHGFEPDRAEPCGIREENVKDEFEMDGGYMRLVSIAPWLQPTDF